MIFSFLKTHSPGCILAHWEKKSKWSTFCTLKAFLMEKRKKKREKKRDLYLEEIFLFVCHKIFSIFSIFLQHFY